ncbi:TrkH family potassium uptake protein [Clostridium malenominatum]|uniref:TrkH family potassium uptake protein n=1 Tax=Clostridium malenominatum TaxID=1539 RepID=A0ABN1J3K4_9CLOT
MNFGMVLKYLGILLISEAIIMTPSLFVSILYKGYDINAFVSTIAILFTVGFLAFAVKPKNKNIYARDGFAIAALGWILISFFGALPFVFSGAIPSIIDAFFEASSGFTTTGASILTEVEGLPYGLLFWRSFTHWAGGMGVLVLTLALLPTIGGGSVQIMKAESPGPTPGKIVPKVGHTAKILYMIYFSITIVQIILLMLTGMPLFDSLVNTFGTVGTGGFSVKNLSIGAYNNVHAEVITTIFMLACGVNFTLYYQMIKGNIKEAFKDEEFKLYIGVVLTSIILITINIYGNIFSSLGQALRHSSFQVASVITTTGYATTDFNQWPGFSKIILILLMFIGASAGSTGGGIKNIRILLLFKSMKRELFKIIHPRAVYTVKFGGKVIEEETLTEILAFFFMYIFIFIIALLIISLEGRDLLTTFTAVAATLGNIGPGLGTVGPMGNFSQFTDLSKIVLSLCMIIGRLEIYPILLLLLPSFWRKVNV